MSGKLSKCKVLLVTRNLEFGGVERRVALIAEFLDRDQFEAEVACLRNGGPYAEHLRSIGIPVHNLSVRSQLNPIVMQRLKSLIRRGQYDLVDCHQTRANIWGTRAARAGGVKGILASNYLIKNWKNPLLRRLEIGGFRIADRIVTDSRQLSEEISIRSGLPREKFATIPNGVPEPTVDGEEVDRLRRRFSLKKEHTVFGMVGRLVPYKGQMLLLRAFNRVAEKIPFVRLLIVGKEGQTGYLAELQEFVAGNSLQKRVIITEYSGNVHNVMSLMDVFVLPSSGESLPISILESLSLAKPVIATDVGGVANAVREGFNGFLIPEKDERALAERLLTLARDKGLRETFSRNSRALYEKDYRLENMIHRVQDLYLSICGGK